MNLPIAVVAGTGGEVGVAVVLGLIGYAVVAVERREDKLGELPDPVHHEVAYATSPTATAPLIGRIVGDVGAADILANTLGAFVRTRLWTARPGQLQSLLDPNRGAAL
jgi:NADP-dependent 3-hydroxy acid dehydrogenase YdfG